MTNTTVFAPVITSCPFLGHLFPTQLINLLTRWDKQQECYLNPIWLHNEGQNLIGFMPKTCFYLLPPAQDKEGSTANLQLLTLTRKALPNFAELIHPPNSQSHNHLSSTNGLQIHLVNNQNTDGLIQQLIEYSNQYSSQENTTQQSNQKNTAENQYIDGLMGFISYDVMAQELAKTDNAKESNNRPDYVSETQPTAFFGHYPIYLTCDIRQNIPHWQLHATSEIAKTMMADVQSWLKYLIKTTKPLIYKTLPLYLAPHWSLDEYTNAFKATQDYLHAGDCYQINLTQKWQGELTQNSTLADHLSKLHTFTNAPFAGYLQITNPKSTPKPTIKDSSQPAVKTTNFELLSCSPELFFTFEKTSKSEYQVKSKPIKGTRPRGNNPKEDIRLKQELANSEKDLAENVMIVDLLRNDLGKYAKTGTVKVPQRFTIESFSNVHHMVSTLSATLQDDVHPLKMLFGSLPSGSITGTPKKRVVEIINELEAQPRGAYCGTMGYMNFDGTGQWNVLIRSLQSNQQKVSLWAGGGITVASDCEEEYKECYDKIGNLLRLLAN